LVEASRSRLAHADDARSEAASVADPHLLRFFQFNPGNARFFTQQRTDLRIPIGETPHYRVAAAATDALGSGRSQARDDYIDYLASSWSSNAVKPTIAELQQRYLRFLELVDRVERGARVAPIRLTKIPSEEGFWVLDGNHRSSIAAALGRSVPAVTVPLAQAVHEAIRSTKGLVARSDIAVTREDITRAFTCSDSANPVRENLGHVERVLAGRRVLVLGSDFGLGVRDALASGATMALGLDTSRASCGWGTRLSIASGMYPRGRLEHFGGRSLRDEERLFDSAIVLPSIWRGGSSEALRIIQEDVQESVVLMGHGDCSGDQITALGALGWGGRASRDELELVSDTIRILHKR
jgi:hypothetical protein